MTLIIGLKSNDCIVIGAEQEESGGIAAKRVVTKLKLITGKEWAVVIGGAGDAAIAENAMRAMEKELHQKEPLSEQGLMDIADKVLDSIHTKYIDKDKNSEGISLVIGAVCGNELHLISTQNRVPQPQEYIAYAGIGADIGIFFIDRLHRINADWKYSATVAGFTLQQAMEACRYCGGESEIYVLQRPPNPRWRSLGTEDAPTEFVNRFNSQVVARHLEGFLRSIPSVSEHYIGYRDEHNPEPISISEADKWFKE